MTAQAQVQAPRDGEPLLEVRDLTVEFSTLDGDVHAVDGVSFDVRPGEVVGIVGESGSGKSVTAMTILGLVRQPPGRIVRGSVRYQGRDLLRLSRRELRTVRGGEIAMVFQDPMTAMNPVMTVGRQITEALRLHNRDMSRAAARARAVELLASVGVPEPGARCRQYPHEFSGGMRQRAMLAMAMANRPKLLIADEPTTALDVTIQAQVLQLIRTAATQTGAATLLITHDLGVIAELADRVLVMYAGRIVERGDVRTIFAAPRHPYTAGLLASLPRLDAAGVDETGDEVPGELAAIGGSPPSLLAVPPGCAFHPRCTLSAGRPECRTTVPDLMATRPGQQAACHFHEELAVEAAGQGAS
jgi:oligopeptide/dipeptide ABC transporter ATP-binding protein